MATAREQVLIGLAVSDASLLRAFVEAHPKILELQRRWEGNQPPARGMWGIGFHTHGEMLVRKGPLQGLGAHGMISHLRDVRARHVVLVAELSPAPKKLEDCSPLRYRDWLFAATGADTLGPGFAQKVQQTLPTYAFSSKRHPGNDEAVMMLLMAELERLNARDTRDLTTRMIQRALASATGQLRALSDDPARIGLMTMLHVRGHLFALALGRPLSVARFRGTGEVARPGRLTRHRHLKALVIGDRVDESVAWEELPPSLAAEIDTGCNLVQFPTA